MTAAALLIGWLALALVFAVGAELERAEAERLARLRARLDGRLITGHARTVAVAGFTPLPAAHVRILVDSGRFRFVDDGFGGQAVEEELEPGLYRLHRRPGDG
jgi:hypothetical protein